MPDPLLLPSIAMLTGGGLLAASDYLTRRLEGTEDRYMALYGQEEWEGSNMDLTVHAPEGRGDELKRAFVGRLEQRIAEDEDIRRAWYEVAEPAPEGRGLVFRVPEGSALDDLMAPRRGFYLDLDQPDRVRVVWNHMASDGVGMWNAVRTLFDPNPPLIPFKDIKPPPPVLPELLAIPSVARRLVWRGRLRHGTVDGAPLTRGLAMWDAGPLRALKDRMDVPFNLLTSALVVWEVFQRHPDRKRLNVGLTAYFPFLEGRNKYGVFLCKVTRGSLEHVVKQFVKQTRRPIVNWGQSSAQSYALGRLPDQAFGRIISYYRKQIDVLVSSLPVGTEPISVQGIPTLVSAHPWELTLPYYFLLLGTRQELHVSFTSRFEQEKGFLDLGNLPV